jgi:succinoglycan biosynthesis protein ExoM
VTPVISVCVATYRRREGLARLLASLAALELPDGVDIEIVVVDNDAEGSAAPILDAWSGPHPLRSLRDARKNLSHIRNRAVEAACGKWMAFIDDDEVADPAWLAAYWHRIALEDYDGWFGPVLTMMEPGGTPWIDPQRFFQRPRHASGSPVSVSDVRTANAFVRRDLVVEHRFDPAYGTPGDAAEDREFFGRLMAAGARFRWCDEAIVTEFVTADRRSMAWITRRALMGGRLTARIASRQGGRWGGLRTGVRALLALLVLGAALPASALGGRSTAVRVWFRLCIQAGRLQELAGLNPGS